MPQKTNAPKVAIIFQVPVRLKNRIAQPVHTAQVAIISGNIAGEPPLHVAGKENPERSQQNNVSIANPDFSKKPPGRDQQPEDLQAPVERKTALEIEEKKAPKLRTKKRRVVSDRNAHQ